MSVEDSILFDAEESDVSKALDSLDTRNIPTVGEGEAALNEIDGSNCHMVLSTTDDSVPQRIIENRLFTTCKLIENDKNSQSEMNLIH